MKPVADLFPETLIVTLIDDQPMTNSVLTAKYFGRKHKNVLQGVNNLLLRTLDEGRRLNFQPSSYLNEQGKRQPMYLLTELGFQFVVSGFTGPEADEWKWQFFEEFAAMKARLSARRDAYVDALDQVRPNLRPVVEGTQGGLNRAAIAAPLGKTCGSVTYHRGQARKLGLLAARGAKQ